MEIKYFRNALAKGADQGAPSTIRPDSCEIYLSISKIQKQITRSTLLSVHYILKKKLAPSVLH